jgi:hypothetical protein
MRNASSFAPLLVLLAALASGSAFAQQTRSRKPPAKEQAQDTPQAQEEQAAAPQPKGKLCDKAAVKQPQRRRSVQQVIQGVTPIPQASGPSYGPVLNPGPRPSPMPAPGPTAASPPPAQINSCNGNHCMDAAGGTYNMGVGNSGTDSQGRLCNRVGNTVQCF